MRIGDLARRTGASVRALRHYEQARLIHAERTANGYRDYPQAALTRVANIRHLLDAGLTVADIRSTFLACLDGDVTTAPPAEPAVRVAAARLAAIDARIASQVALRERLAAALAGRLDGQPAGGRQAPNEQDVPASPAHPPTGAPGAPTSREMFQNSA